MSKWIVPIVLLVLLAAGLIPRWSQSMAAQRQGEATPKFLVVHPRPAKAEEFELPASIQAYWETVVSARASGYCKERRVDIGAHVRKGEILAILTAPEVEQRTAQTQAELRRAEAAAFQAHSEVSRSNATRAAAVAQVPRALSRLAQAQAGVQKAVAGVTQARTVVRSRSADRERLSAQLELARASDQRHQGLLAQGFATQQEADEQHTALLAAQAQFEAGKAALDEARSQVAVAESLLVAARAEVDAARGDVVATREAAAAAQAGVRSSLASQSASVAGVESNRAQSESQQLLESYQEIRAPFAGVITSRTIEQGGLVNGGSTPSPLFGIARVDKLKILLRVPQAYVADIKVGDSVAVVIPEQPTVRHAAKVTKMAGALEAATHTRLVEVGMNNPGEKILPGTYSKVIFSLPPREVVLVPSNAIKLDKMGTLAMVVEEGRLNERKVTLGRDFGKEVEILDGLKATDLVLMTPSTPVPLGAQVEAVMLTPTPSPTSRPQEAKPGAK